MAFGRGRYFACGRAGLELNFGQNHMPKKKRYFFSVVEEMVMNPKFDGYRGGRIEVYDRKGKESSGCYEARFLIPEEFMVDFRKMWDFKESDEMPYIRWDYAEVEKSRINSKNVG